MVEDTKVLLGIVATSIVVYNGLRYVVSHVHKRRSPLIPVGTVSALYVYPVKSCKGKSVFSMYCDEMGPVVGEMRDRQFLVINGKDGRFYTGRQKPCMLLIDCDVRDGWLSMTYVDGSTVRVELEAVMRRNDVRTARLFNNERTDGLDCGNDASAFLSAILDEPDTRLLMHVKGLFTDRGCATKRSTWNSEIPLRFDKTPFADDAPFMINSQASLDDLNTRLEEKVTIERFRPVILVDNCAAWDEDNWLSVHIGDVSLQCLQPCLRCVMTTIHPTKGVKHPQVEPLKTLRKFRLAPEGPMRDDCKDNPIFGVDAGIITPGFIHVGATVYVRYKSSHLKSTPFYSS